MMHEPVNAAPAIAICDSCGRVTDLPAGADPAAPFYCTALCQAERLVTIWPRGQAEPTTGVPMRDAGCRLRGERFGSLTVLRIHAGAEPPHHGSFAADRPAQFLLGREGLQGLIDQLERLKADLPTQKENHDATR